MRAAVATVGAKSSFVAAAIVDSSCLPATELDRLREKGLPKSILRRGNGKGVQAAILAC